MSKGNVLVCVTRQKTCGRLISYGTELAEGEGGTLMVVHIAEYDFREINEDGKAENLELLHRIALTHGTNLMIIRSNLVAHTLAAIIDRNGITKVVMGESNKVDAENTVETLKGMVDEKVKILSVPLNSDSDEEDESENTQEALAYGNEQAD